MDSTSPEQKGTEGLSGESGAHSNGQYRSNFREAFTINCGHKSTSWLKSKRMQIVIFNYSELVTARESATTICVWAETKQHAEVWESFMVEERKDTNGPPKEAAYLGKTGGGYEKWGVPCEGIRGHIVSLYWS